VSPGSHAAGDGSFGRSAGTNLGKALALVALAVVIGAVLLRHNGAPVRVSAVGATSSTLSHTNPTTTAAPTTAASVALRGPADIKVLVANATAAGGLATRYSDKLHGLGYNTLASTNSTVKLQASVVYYAPGYQQEGAVVAQQLGLRTTAVQPLPAPGQVPVANLDGANLLVLIGTDLETSGGTGGGPGSTTATTRHTTTTVRPTTTSHT
jgi:hypothetical protein